MTRRAVVGAGVVLLVPVGVFGAVWIVANVWSVRDPFGALACQRSIPAWLSPVLSYEASSLMRAVTVGAGIIGLALLRPARLASQRPHLFRRVVAWLAGFAVTAAAVKASFALYYPAARVVNPLVDPLIGIRRDYCPIDITEGVPKDYLAWAGAAEEVVFTGVFGLLAVRYPRYRWPLLAASVAGRSLMHVGWGRSAAGFLFIIPLAVVGLAYVSWTGYVLPVIAIHFVHNYCQAIGIGEDWYRYIYVWEPYLALAGAVIVGWWLLANRRFPYAASLTRSRT